MGVTEAPHFLLASCLLVELMLLMFSGVLDIFHGYVIVEFV